jgi:DnaJ like chaperone protein
MSIWGKIGGAAAGFVLGGGPLGALLGAAAGHALFDRGEDRPPEETVAFTIGTVALVAKMAKADGNVSDTEYNAFRKIVVVPPDEERHVRRVFELARHDVAGFDAYARQLASLLKARPGLLEDLLDSLFFVAASDGAFHPAEMEYLRKVAEIFGISESAFSRLCAAYGGPCEPDPYSLLNIDADATDAEVRKAYLHAVKDNHPDSLASRGAPPEFYPVASEKLARINAAYEKIKTERATGLRAFRR